MADDKRDGSGRAELRLALVCYGGVSLAVYMHGVTKELQSLIRAARAFDAKAPERLEDEYAIGTEPAYYAALADLAERRSASGNKLKPLSVSIDIIGGTSAGGINGIALSKALATGASQQPLKRVWINRGDIRTLLRAPMIWLPFQASFAVAAQLFRLGSTTTPLKGEFMSQLIFGALRNMDKGPLDAPLVPDGGILELYVPATDLDGFDVLLPSGAGGASNRDRQHAQVFEFRAETGVSNQFDADHTTDLAFAARASASFPGAFAPISQATFAGDIGKLKDDAGQKYRDLTFHPEVFHSQYPMADEGKDVYFVDGGVLDNAPFDVVISAIARRRADSEVYRRLVYIEPDPGRKLYSTNIETHTTKRRWLKDLLAVSKVKGGHGFLRELLALRDMNDRIGEVSAIAERQSNYVIGAVGIAQKNAEGLPWDESTVAPMDFGKAAATEIVAANARDVDIEGIAKEMYIWAKDDLGPVFSTYQRLKFDAAIERLAIALVGRFKYSGRSGQASFVQSALDAWVREQDFWNTEPCRDKGVPPGDALGDKLGPIDVPYRDRRLMFILAGISEMYQPQKDADGVVHPPPPTEDLDGLKAAAWSLRDKLRAAPYAVVNELPDDTVDFLADLHAPGSDAQPENDPLLTDPAVFAKKYSNEIGALIDAYKDGLDKQLEGDGSTKLLEAFQAHTKNWEERARAALLSRYLGFPLWDGMIFPTVSMTRVPQLTKIGVRQFSPLMATKLSPPAEKAKRSLWRLFRKTKQSPDKSGAAPAKLKGIPVSHFAGFFAAKNRENDYLWGRLDCAELILRLLSEVGDSMVPAEVTVPQGDPPIPHLAAALQMVLDTETDDGEGKEPLTHVGELIKHVQAQVKKLAEAEQAAEPQAGQRDSAASAVANQGRESLSV